MCVWDCRLLLISRVEDPVQDLSIAKANRHKLVWEALALSNRRDVRLMYTQHSENTRQCPSYQAKEDNGCNVCGASCTETLCEFRCCSRARGARARSLGRDVEVAGGNGDDREEQW